MKHYPSVFARDDCSLDRISQRADVARPAVRLERGEAFIVRPISVFALVTIDRGDRVRDKRLQVFDPLAQRWNENRKDVEPKKKALPQPSLGHRLLWRAIGRGGRRPRWR